MVYDFIRLALSRLLASLSTAYRYRSTSDVLGCWASPVGRNLRASPAWCWRVRNLRSHPPVMELISEVPKRLAVHFTSITCIRTYRLVSIRHQQGGVQFETPLVYTLSCSLDCRLLANDALSISSKVLVVYCEEAKGHYFFFRFRNSLYAFRNLSRLLFGASSYRNWNLSKLECVFILLPTLFLSRATFVESPINYAVLLSTFCSS